MTEGTHLELPHTAACKEIRTLSVVLLASHTHLLCVMPDNPLEKELPEEVLCSAGIIAFGIGRSGHHVRASGWGPVFLDMGSGYDIGESCQNSLLARLV